MDIGSGSPCACTTIDLRNPQSHQFNHRIFPALFANALFYPSHGFDSFDGLIIGFSKKLLHDFVLAGKGAKRSAH
jgi:hypothetical protein